MYANYSYVHTAFEFNSPEANPQANPEVNFKLVNSKAVWT